MSCTANLTLTESWILADRRATASVLTTDFVFSHNSHLTGRGDWFALFQHSGNTLELLLSSSGLIRSYIKAHPCNTQSNQTARPHSSSYATISLTSIFLFHYISLTASICSVLSLSLLTSRGYTQFLNTLALSNPCKS